MSWFSPKLPVDSETKQWVDDGFEWMIDEFGPEVFHSVEILLPIEEHFPDVYSGSRASIRQMLNRICVYMEVDPELVEVRYFENEDSTRYHPLMADGETHGHTLGTYRMRKDGKHVISLDTSQAANPQMMAATIAHELGHVILHGEGRLEEGRADDELMTS